MSKGKPTKTRVHDKLTSVFANAHITIRNIQHLLEATCLLIVAGYGFWASVNVPFGIEHAELVLRFASVAIGLRGAYEFIKQMRGSNE